MDPLKWGRGEEVKRFFSKNHQIKRKIKRANFSESNIKTVGKRIKWWEPTGG